MKNQEFNKPLSSTQLLYVALLISTFLVGYLLAKVQSGTSIAGVNTGGTAQNGAQAPEAAAPQAPAEDTSPRAVKLDDDPVLGDPNAPVTIVEFSDYECPFCKRHFEQTYAQLKTEYIDTGKVKLVFRDLPLTFHDPMATSEAIAANCAREQGNDATYYQYHDELFKRTTSNGNGLTVDQLYTIASDLGLNSDQLKSCVEAKKYEDEVKKDLADAGTSGATATPSFFIGKSGNGEIQGTPLIGAQPFSAFKTLIDQQLGS